MENVESVDDGKVLRIVRMSSETPPQQTSFGSEYLTWRETKSDVYCKQEDPLLLNLLRWNDISTAHSIQWWTPIPYGFGAFWDVRSGSQLVVIAGAVRTSSVMFDSLFFENPQYYLPGFQRSKVDNGRFTMHPEAILLTPGMRMCVARVLK